MVSAASGRSNISNPTFTRRFGADAHRETPQSAGSWTTKTPMPTARHALSAGVVNGTLYAVGGENSVSGFLNTVEAFSTH